MLKDLIQLLNQKKYQMKLLVVTFNDIAMVYSGDAVDILQETERYSYFIPERSNVWVDGFVIPVNTRHEDWASNL